MSVRDNNWLISRLDHLWTNFFPEIPQKNKVYIRFSRVSKYRFGSIRLHPKTKESLILINGLFREEKVPEEVVDHTIAHELVHYAHGFSSPLQKLHKYPHKGGVIDKEMAARGLQHLTKAYKVWLKEYKKSFKPTVRRRRRRVIKIRWI